MDGRASSRMNEAEDLLYFFQNAASQPTGSVSVFNYQKHWQQTEVRRLPNEETCQRDIDINRSHCNQQMSSQIFEHVYNEKQLINHSRQQDNASYLHTREQQHVTLPTYGMRSCDEERKVLKQSFDHHEKPKRTDHHEPSTMIYYPEYIEEEMHLTFDGNSNFNDFIVQFECVSSIYKWSYETKGQKLMMSLKDKAVGVLGTLQASQRTDFESLKTALQNRFDPVLDQDLTGLQWQKRKKKKNESYVSFAMDLKKLLLTTYLNWPEECIERLAREHFFSCIDDKYLRGLLWSKSPVNLIEAASMADSLEELFLQERIRDERENEHTHLMKAEEEQIETEFHQHEILHSEYQYEEHLCKVRERRRRHKRRKRCHTCQQEGHLMRDCPETTKIDKMENCWTLRLMAKPQQTATGQH